MSAFAAYEPGRPATAAAALVPVVARMTAIAERADAVWHFANGRNRACLDLHSDLGFVEVTRGFWFPDLAFDGGVGVLARAPVR